MGRPDYAAGLAANVNRLRRVFFEMGTHDADLGVAFGGRDDEEAGDAERLVVLRDLVALGIVGIEVVLAVEDRALGDPAVERVPKLDRPFHRSLVRHG